MVENDEALVKLILAGNKSRYEDLVRKYQNKVFQLTYRMTLSREDAHDLTQESFIQAYNSLGQFKGRSSFYTWIYRIASNKTLDFLRRQNRIAANSGTLNTQYRLEEAYKADDVNPEQILIRKEQREIVQQALNSLPDNYRLVLILNHYEALTYKEIANILNVPVKTVATRIFRARLIMKETLLKGGRKNGLPHL